jgi:hypothetical protein
MSCLSAEIIIIYLKYWRIRNIPGSWDTEVPPSLESSACTRAGLPLVARHD